VLARLIHDVPSRFGRALVVDEKLGPRPAKLLAFMSARFCLNPFSPGSFAREPEDLEGRAGVWTHPIETTRQALTLAESGRYPLEKFISHDFPLDEAERAVRSIGREIAEIDPIKVSLIP
jgi:threonine dehydrogenase-like Zn-dependent dehydrogenase